jgi:hypothetical protein
LTTTKKNNQPARMSRGRILLIAWCLIGAAWTCRGVLAGHRVRDYTFEEALALVKQRNTDPSSACFVLRERIVEAVNALREAGPHGDVALEAIHKESHR